MSSQPDPYKILGVTKDAELPEIRSAHRKLVLKCHPDKVQDPTLKAAKQDEFQKVQQAYEILSNDKERRRYDDQMRLAELKAQMQSRANVSVPRAGATKFDVKINETRPSSYKSASSPNVKQYPYSSSYEEEKRSSSRPRYYEPEPRSSKSRDPERAARREEKEREKEREREREKEKEHRERRKKEKREKEAAEDLRRAEKALRKERREQDKVRSKGLKKESEEKRRDNYGDIHVDVDDDEPSYSSKKKPSRRHEEKRDRSTHPEDSSRYTSEEPEATKIPSAMDYISRTRGLDRSASYYVPAPTPPNNGQASAFAPPDDDVRRSAAKARRGSDDHKEKSHRKSSREQFDAEPIPLSSSPPRHGSSYPKSSSRPEMGSSPPHLSRTTSMPVTSSTRPPTATRSSTFYSGETTESPGNRGRNRSRHQSQLVEETESEDERERRHQRKHRSSKKHRSPSRNGMEKHYHVDAATGRSKLAYSRVVPEEYEQGGSYYYDYADRPAMYPRADSGYASHFPKVKTSKPYSHGDVSYSSYEHPSYAEYTSATMA